MTLENAGDYRVSVANAGGESVTSDIAHLEVIMPPFTKIVSADVPYGAGVSPIIEEVAHRLRVIPHVTTATQ